MSGSKAAGDQVIPLPHAAGYIVGCLTIPLPTIAYWQFGGNELFGEHALTKLVILAGIGGGIGGALFAERGFRLIAILSGIIGGVGVAEILVFYTTFFHKHSLLTPEIAIVEVAGALPGICLFFLLQKIFSKNSVDESGNRSASVPPSRHPPNSE